jgi:hypothetical protein
MVKINESNDGNKLMERRSTVVINPRGRITVWRHGRTRIIDHYREMAGINDRATNCSEPLIWRTTIYSRTTNPINEEEDRPLITEWINDDPLKRYRVAHNKNLGNHIKEDQTMEILSSIERGDQQLSSNCG